MLYVPLLVAWGIFLSCTSLMLAVIFHLFSCVPVLQGFCDCSLMLSARGCSCVSGVLLLGLGLTLTLTLQVALHVSLCLSLWLLLRLLLMLRLRIQDSNHAKASDSFTAGSGL